MGFRMLGAQCSSFWLCHSGAFRNPDKPQFRSWRDWFREALCPQGGASPHSVCAVRMTTPLFQASGLLSVITDPIHTPVTLFWPTDKALQAIPQEQQDFLFSEDNKDKLKEYLKFHVIRDSKVVFPMSQRKMRSTPEAS